MTGFKHVSGVITLVQEHRFRLAQDGGGHRLFILTHDARQEWSDLQNMAQAACRVRVRYSEDNTLTAASAHAVSYL